MQGLKNIVAVVAHPDDLAVCMSGTALLLKDICKLHVICATRGEGGVPGWSYEKTASIRSREEEAACLALNAELIFLGEINDHKMCADRRLCDRVFGLFKDIDPVAIFTLWPVDLHPDHSIVSSIAMKAYNFWGNSRCEFHFFPAALCQARLFTGDVFVDTSAVMDEKRNIVRLHLCQNKDDKLVGEMQKMNLHYSKELGCEGLEYVEAFKTFSLNEGYAGRNDVFELIRNGKVYRVHVPSRSLLP